MGEATVDSSSESGDDGQETEEDKRNYREALKKADSYIQLRSSMQRGHKHKKRAKVLHFAQTRDIDPKLQAIRKEHEQRKKDPNSAFGKGANTYFNTRDGDAPGTEI